MSLPFEGDSSDQSVPGITGANSAGGIGVLGQSDSAGGIGLLGRSAGGIAVRGESTASPPGIAGLFIGDVSVNGNLTAQDISLLAGGGVQLAAPASGSGMRLSKLDGTNCDIVEILASQVTCPNKLSVGSAHSPGAVVVNDSQGNAVVKLDGGSAGGSVSVAGAATIGDTLSVTGTVSSLGDLMVAGKLTATSLAGDGAGLTNVTAKDSSITSAKLNSLTDQVQALTAQVNQLTGDLNRRFEQLNGRVDAIINMINANGKIVDMKVAFGVDGGGGGLVFTRGLDYVDSPIKTTHTGVLSGDVIFMIAMVHGYNSDGGPGFARGRIIRTSSGGFDVQGTEDTITYHSVVTFAGDFHSRPVPTEGSDVDGGGTLMIAATADGSGTYDCRVQIRQRAAGFGAMQLQHMMSLVFRPAA